MSSAVLGVAVLGDLILGSVGTSSIAVQASHNLNFVQSALSFNATQTASSALNFSEGAVCTTVDSTTDSNTLTFTQFATVELRESFSGYGSLGRVDSQIGRSFLLGKAPPAAFKGVVALQTLTFTETSLGSLDDLAFGVENHVAFSQLAECNLKAVEASQLWEPTDLAVGDRFKPVSNTLSLSQTASVQKVVSINANDEILFAQAPTVLTVRDQVRYYAPDTSRPEFQRPNIQRRTGVIFDYDGLTLELKTPEPDNKFRSVTNRVNRESLGGEQIVYRDPLWVNRQTLLIDIVNVHVDKMETVLEFLAASLGKEITFTDWESREWRGVILNPDEFIVNNTRDHFDISIEIEAQAL